ncbi:MAG TPA: hypothetical protein VLH08_06110, partial [Acidobacteriota bacterium]|nr:hypothetical protein [Acidobacteriota bacterium]
ISMKIPDEDLKNENLQWIEMLDRNYQAALDLLPLRTRKAYENQILAGNCYRLMNDPSKAHAAYDAARIELKNLLQKAPEMEGSSSAYFHSSISLAYAGLMHKAEAIREAKMAIELLPVSRDAMEGPDFVRNLAIVYVMIGDYDDAISQIDLFSSEWSGTLLWIDPVWDPLRRHPRFQKILEKYNHG